MVVFAILGAKAMVVQSKVVASKVVPEMVPRQSRDSMFPGTQSLVRVCLKVVLEHADQLLRQALQVEPSGTVRLSPQGVVCCLVQLTFPHPGQLWLPGTSDQLF